MQFGFMPGSGTVNALFIVRRPQEEYLLTNRKLYLCFVDLEKAFDRVPRKVVEWSLQTKGVPEVIVVAMISLFEETTTKMRVRSDVTVDFGANVGVHQALYYHRFYSQWYGCVVMEYARKVCHMKYCLREIWY